MSDMPGSESSFHFRSALGVGLISLLVGTGFYLLGFLSTGWTKNSVGGYDFSEGLWELCAARSNFDIPDDGWHMATRAMMTLGLICLLTTLLLLLGFIFVKRLSQWKSVLRIVIPLVSLAAVVLSLIGLIVYGVNRASPNWSYAVTVIACSCMLVSTICMAVAFFTGSRGL